ncbi:hypothetical protein [Thermoproteus tenax]|uniref:Uncharacterized protein n=1 Tax=Thermoproteus tenax (strain ATCC 35583 / DSM 2078 / JCM 9277 / NBRC 100435 / Kra 1) TaxID=768679 RepID=G4RNV9_THETK|nr:hypothetical protein [Thermoproteus tenax]CCC81253.1 hypothetical protein TTX_0589 [Thermoproteus tenax Kra 1]
MIKSNYKKIYEQIIKILEELNVDIEELSPCEIYLNYLNYKLSYIERILYNLMEKINFIENRCDKNRKEIYK